MTLSQLCLYLGCNEAYFRTFKHQLKDGEKDFNTVIDQIEQTIYNQKFQGASGNLLNANIIARDLGLVDKQETEHSGTIKTVDLSQIETSDLIKRLELVQKLDAKK